MTAAVSTAAGDLATALHAALLFADDNDGFPDLAAVYIETGEGKLTATATNRYVLGRAAVTASGSLPRGVLVDRDQAAHIAAYLGDAYLVDPVTLTILDSCLTGQRLRVEHSQSGLAIEVPSRAKPEPLDPWISYQTILQRFNEVDAQAGVSTMLLNPYSVRPVAGLGELYVGIPARWTFIGAREPVRVELGNAFTAVLMPAAPNDQTDTFWPILAAAHQV